MPKSKDHDCTYCIHFRFDEGWVGTEVTPGDPASIECSKGFWSLTSPWSGRKFRLNVASGVACQSFEATPE